MPQSYGKKRLTPSFESYAPLCLLLTGLFAMLFQFGGIFYRDHGILIALGVSLALILLLAAVFLLQKKPIHKISFLFIPYWLYLACNTWFHSLAPWTGWLSIGAIGVSGLIFFTTCNLFRDASVKKLLMAGLFAAGILNTLASLYQAYGPSDSFPFTSDILLRFRGRAEGLFGQANGNAAFLALLIPIPGFLIFQQKMKKQWRILAALTFATMLWALMLTMSRGAMIAMVPSLICLSILANQTWKARMMAIMLLLGIYAAEYKTLESLRPYAGKRVQNLVHKGGDDFRKQYYSAALTMFQTKPLFGAGNSSYEVLWSTYHPNPLLNTERYAHSDPLESLAETGIVGFLLFFGAIAYLWFTNAIHLLRNPQDANLYHVVALTGIAGLMVHSCVDFPFKYTAIHCVAFIYLGLLAQNSNRHTFTLTSNKNKLRTGIFLTTSLILIYLCIRPASLWREHYAIFNEHSKIEAYSKTNDHESRLKAIKDLNKQYLKVLEREPNYPPTLYRLAQAHLLLIEYDFSDKEKYAKNALILLDRAIDLSPEHWRHWYEHAEVLSLLKGHEEDATSSYQKALEIAPQHIIPLLGYANHLIRTAQYDEAQTLIDEAARLFPMHPMVRQAQEKLQRALTKKKPKAEALGLK